MGTHINNTYIPRTHSVVEAIVIRFSSGLQWNTYSWVWVSVLLVAVSDPTPERIIYFLLIWVSKAQEIQFFLTSSLNCDFDKCPH